MKIEEIVEVKKEDFYQYLVKLILSDIQKNYPDTKENDLLDGYEYMRKIAYNNKEIVINMKVGPLIKDRYFEVSYSSNGNFNRYYYDLRDCDKGCIVCYYEENKPAKESKLNNWLKQRRESIIRQKAVSSIHTMEQAIIEDIGGMVWR